MPEETGLDPAIPPIGWQDADRESQPLIRRQRSPRKKKKRAPAAPATPSKKQPDESTGTNIDVIV